VKKGSSTASRTVAFGLLLVALMVTANAFAWWRESQVEPRELLIEILPEEVLEITSPEWETPAGEPTQPSPEDPASEIVPSLSPAAAEPDHD
jgi:outer membrane biosynthesis protein TonB